MIGMLERLRMIAILAGLSPLAAAAAAPLDTPARTEPVTERGRHSIHVADGRNCRVYLPTVGATVAVPCPDFKDSPASPNTPPAPGRHRDTGGPAEPDATRPAAPRPPQRSRTAAHTAGPSAAPPARREDCRYYEPYLGRTFAIPCHEMTDAQGKPQPAAVGARTLPARGTSPSAAGVAASRGGSPSCAALVERGQLGNPLSLDERERLRSQCRR